MPLTKSFMYIAMPDPQMPGYYFAKKLIQNQSIKFDFPEIVALLLTKEKTVRRVIMSGYEYEITGALEAKLDSLDGISDARRHWKESGLFEMAMSNYVYLFKDGLWYDVTETSTDTRQPVLLPILTIEDLDELFSTYGYKLMQRSNHNVPRLGDIFIKGGEICKVIALLESVRYEHRVMVQRIGQELPNGFYTLMSPDSPLVKLERQRIFDGIRIMIYYSKEDADGTT